MQHWMCERLAQLIAELAQVSGDHILHIATLAKHHIDYRFLELCGCGGVLWRQHSGQLRHLVCSGDVT